MKASNRWQQVRHFAAEPFVRFIILGALIFAVHAAVVTRSAGGQRHISISATDVDRLRAMATKQWGREPGPEQTSELIRAFVREEVLYREAVASGLDRDDVIVRRRLAQKMEFLAQEGVRGPNDAELQAHFQAHAADYAQPETLTLSQLTFSRRIRGDGAEGDAARALAALRAGQPGRGDSSMLDGELRGQTQAALARDFGAEFAQAVYVLPTGQWSGPIVSDLGVHLVRVSARDRGGVAPFDEVRDRVRADALNQRVTQAREAAYARALARYTVSVSNQYRQVIAATLPLEPQP